MARFAYLECHFQNVPIHNRIFEAFQYLARANPTKFLVLDFFDEGECITMNITIIYYEIIPEA